MSLMRAIELFEAEIAKNNRTYAQRTAGRDPLYPDTIAIMVRDEANERALWAIELLHNEIQRQNGKVPTA